MEAMPSRLRLTSTILRTAGESSIIITRLFMLLFSLSVCLSAPCGSEGKRAWGTPPHPRKGAGRPFEPRFFPPLQQPRLSRAESGHIHSLREILPHTPLLSVLAEVVSRGVGLPRPRRAEALMRAGQAHAPTSQARRYVVAGLAPARSHISQVPHQPRLPQPGS